MSKATVMFAEMNSRGGWSLRYKGESSEDAIGNYATAADAVKIARPQCDRVEIIRSPSPHAITRQPAHQHASQT